MPIYEYECNECGHQFEALQKMSDDVLTDCPQCEKSALRKLVSAAAFRLKGKGWYETDFKGDGKKNLSSADSSKPASSSKEDSSNNKKSDKKEAAKKNKKSSDSGKTAASKATGKSGGGSNK